jgi:tight adherence protein C
MSFWFDNLIFEKHGLMIAMSTCLMAVAWGVWAILHLLFFRQPDSDQHPFETQRRVELRDGSFLYCWLEPLVNEVEKIAKLRKPKSLQRLENSLVQADEPLPWRATDYFAMKCIEGGLVASAVFGFVAAIYSTDFAILASLVTVGGYGFLAEQSINSKAEKRAKSVKKRLPYAVDLIALMMQAGASFQDSIQTFVEESKGHPLADELQAMQKQVELGRSQSDALASLNTRVGDEDLSELVFAINKGEELGTPITSILRDQADQMRMKRSQWGEKAAAEAGVKVVFPGMFIVIACLLAVVTPFALPILDALK